MPPIQQTPASLTSDERGGVAVIFALTTTIVVAMAGAAVDFGRVMNARTEMQAVLDAAVLAGTTKYQASGSKAQAETMVRAMFETKYAGSSTASAAASPATSVSGAPILSFPATSAVVTAHAAAKVATPFLSVLSLNDVEIVAQSSGMLGSKKLEMSLMFDVTGSMNDSTSTGTKIADAKAAAKDLMDIVMPATGILDSRVSLVPFSQRVKLDADTIAAITGEPKTKSIAHTTTTTVDTYTISTSSFDWKKYDKCVDRLKDKYFKKLGQSDSTAEANAEAYCNTVETRLHNGKTQYKTPDIDEGEQTTTNTTYTTEYIKPCVVERSTSDSSRKTGEQAPAANEWTASYSSTETEDVSCPPNGANGTGNVIPLTKNRDQIRAAIDALQTGGSTAGQIGTAWAWYTISELWQNIWPTASRPANYGTTDVIKAVVLMTDGAYNSCNGSSSWCSNSATQAVALCNGMKARGIQVWTIGFGMSTNPTDPARTTLVSCADAGRYYFPYNGDELRDAFRDIGAQLTAGTVGARLVAD